MFRWCMLLTRKTRRRSRGESLDLGSESAGGEGDAASNGDVEDVGMMMKTGKVSLGKIKKGAKVISSILVKRDLNSMFGEYGAKPPAS